jgi:GNAT superfamily N-acetyltransferase
MRHRVNIRPAHASDTSAVLVFLREIWDGEDYLQEVWEEWLKASSGQLVVAELDGDPIATGRIVDLRWGEFWMEGLRVAKSYRGMGIAGQIQDHLLEFWERSGGESVGYLTHRDQRAVHHLAEKGHFEAQFRVQMLRWKAEQGVHGFQPCDELTGAVERFTKWSKANSLDGRMEVGWTYPKIVLERLQEDKRVWSWKGDRAFVVLDQDNWEAMDIGVLMCLSVEPEDHRAFFTDLKRLCSMLELSGGRWFAPLPIVQAVLELGVDMEIVEDLEMVAYLRFR